jgi:hypothetical protein
MFSPFSTYPVTRGSVRERRPEWLPEGTWLMVKDDIQPSLNIREAYVFSVAILLRNDCEKLNKVNVSISL